MRGQILGVESGPNNERLGVLLGPSEERRMFPLAEWRSAGSPQPGQWVDFVADGEGARSVYLIATAQSPQAAAVSSGATSSFILGAIGTGCLVLGLLVPVLPTLAAFVLGVIGAGRAQIEGDPTGLALSRISWIGALVLMGLGIVALVVVLAFFGGMMGLWMNWDGWRVHT